MLRLALVATMLLGLAAPAFAAGETMVTEVIPIGYRPLSEVIPIIKPLVPPPGSVGGLRNQLVVRTTPGNMADIKRILASLDRAPTNLLISVRQGVNDAIRRDLVEGFGTLAGDSGFVATDRDANDARRGLSVGVGSGEDAAGVRVIRTLGTSDDRDVQRVRVLEGREAFIATGQSVPVADRNVRITGTWVDTIQQGVRYKNVTKGFYVRPRLNGDRVTVDISPRRDSLSPRDGGVIDVRNASTVVSGQLGRWMEVAGVSEESAGSVREITRSTRSSASSEYSVYIKVERLE